MQKSLIRHIMRSAIAWMCLSGMIDITTAGAGCAARDMQLLKMIEERETTKTVPAAALSAALVEMLHARLVCHSGRVMDALAIYDSVRGSITVAPLTAQQPGGPVLSGHTDGTAR